MQAANNRDSNLAAENLSGSTSSSDEGSCGISCILLIASVCFVVVCAVVIGVGFFINRAPKRRPPLDDDAAEHDEEGDMVAVPNPLAVDDMAVEDVDDDDDAAVSPRDGPAHDDVVNLMAQRSMTLNRSGGRAHPALAADALDATASGAGMPAAGGPGAAGAPHDAHELDDLDLEDTFPLISPSAVAPTFRRGSPSFRPTAPFGSAAGAAAPFASSGSFLPPSKT